MNDNKWKRVRAGIYERGSFRICRVQYADMSTRSGYFKTGWEIQKNGKRWWKEALPTLKDAQYMCEDN